MNQNCDKYYEDNQAVQFLQYINILEIIDLIYEYIYSYICI